ncbi:hypothetical protein VNO77_41501 [Canavalia gladiata]|uniref:Uncharacterized protein n=1 Tax=Canavalia gladiata TaxID=3824 RepID=A0AAN9K2J8_CANGL
MLQNQSRYPYKIDIKSIRDICITRRDIQVGHISSKAADSLYVEEIDVGEEPTRAAVSGLGLCANFEMLSKSAQLSIPCFVLPGQVGHFSAHIEELKVFRLKS